MKEGDFIKAKLRYYKDKLKTKEGIVDFFLGSFIWGAVIVGFTAAIFGGIKAAIMSILPVELLANILAIWIFGIISLGFGYSITLITVYLYRMIRKIIRW